MGKIKDNIIVSLLVGGVGILCLLPTIAGVVIWLLLNPITFWMKLGLLVVLLGAFGALQIWAIILFMMMIFHVFSDGGSR